MDCALDGDEDGLDDITEMDLGTDATAADSDGDGFSDGTEASLGSDPLAAASTPEDRSVAGVCSDGLDNDFDGLTDGADPGCADADGDGVPDFRDLCPGDPDPEQFDLDGDGLGIPCDEDDDGDLVLDALDACPGTIPSEEVDATGCSQRQTEGADSCVISPITLCLSQDRFRVEVEWQDFQGGEGLGQAATLTGDSGYFWFFDPGNVELVIKVLDACSFADRFWVFAAGLTNVAVDITVTDTETGAVKVYRNESGNAFAPILDTAAFATCP